MITRSFIINSDKFKRRKLTTLQHKLRVVMKCYTVFDFFLNENNNTFVFKKSHKINGIKLNLDKEHSGHYRVEEINENEINLHITVI